MTKRDSTASFIKKAITVHGGKYKYDRTKYADSRSKLVITCPEHGDFHQVPASHLQGSGCLQCSYKGLTYTQNAYIDKAKTVHHCGKYSYDNVTYKNKRHKILITCKYHGNFEQRPDLHLMGHGCPQCGDNKSRLSIKDFIRRSKSAHGDGKYSYKKSKYKGVNSELTLICKEHGDFLIIPRNHLRGQGCPQCLSTSTGYSRTYFKQTCDKNSKGVGTLYLIECFSEKEVFYKIGITSRDITTRFGNKDKMPYNFKVRSIIKGKAEYIYNLEKKLHQFQKEYRYKPKIVFAGNTECFSELTQHVRNILKVD